jgi:hypothetical protein
MAATARPAELFSSTTKTYAKVGRAHSRKIETSRSREILYAQEHRCDRGPHGDFVFGVARFGSRRRRSDQRAFEVQQRRPEPGPRPKRPLYDHRILFVFGEIVDAEALSGRRSAPRLRQRIF